MEDVAAIMTTPTQLTKRKKTLSDEFRQNIRAPHTHKLPNIAEYPMFELLFQDRNRIFAS